MGTGSEDFGCNFMEGISDTWEILKEGVSAVQAFATYESKGVMLPCRHPKEIQRLTAGKRVHGMTVDQWAQDRAEGMMSIAQLKEYCNEVPMLFEEVERLKAEHYTIVLERMRL